MSDIVERLNLTTNKTDEIRNADGFIVSPDGGGGGYGGSGYVDNTPGAASVDRAEINSLRAENKRLRLALQPFAYEAMWWTGYSDSEHLVENFFGYEGRITVGDCRRARAALETKDN